MNKMTAVVFDGEKQAYEGSRALRDLDREGILTLYADAVITKDAGGTVSVLRAPDEGPVGTLSGLLVGSMIGLLGGPIGLAIGAGTGTLVGAAVDVTQAGIGSDFLEEVSESLEPGKAAVLAEVDEGWQTPLDSRMETLGGRIFRRNRIQVEDAYFEKEIAAYNAELDTLKAELEKASTERKARLQAKVEETKKKLRSKQEELQARMESVKREGDAKIESLQRQIAAARDDQKQRMTERLARMRSEYQQRTAKLHEAWELTKSALAP